LHVLETLALYPTFRYRFCQGCGLLGNGDLRLDFFHDQELETV
jgi:hypothetical protein